MIRGEGTMRFPTLTISLLLLGTSVAALAATPPVTINYQGVLRDAADNPLSGDHDMVFRYFDASAAGTEIMYEEHLAAGTGAVSTSAGLFKVVLGTGNILDGVGAGTYNQLPDLFRDFSDVWVQLEVNAETLSPRMKVAATAYAHNASNLAGKAAGEFVDTSAATQVKAGRMTS